MGTILITGAAGLIGSMLRTRLAQPGRRLRLLDVTPLTAGPGEEVISVSVTDLDALTKACAGAEAVMKPRSRSAPSSSHSWEGGNESLSKRGVTMRLRGRHGYVI